MSAFAPPDHNWARLSPRYIALLRLTLAAPAAVVALVLLSGAAILNNSALRIVAVTLGVCAAAAAFWLWRWAPRSYARWGYIEGPEEFQISRGIAFRRAVTIPYGRMQFVDVRSGPLERLFGLASVTLHTASTKTAATIPGLSETTARHLRDRLTELGEARGAGL